MAHFTVHTSCYCFLDLICVTLSERETDCHLLLRCKGLASLTWLHLLQVVPKPDTLTALVAKLDLDYHYIPKKIPNPNKLAHKNRWLNWFQHQPLLKKQPSTKVVLVIRQWWLSEFMSDYKFK